MYQYVNWKNNSGKNQPLQCTTWTLYLKSNQKYLTTGLTYVMSYIDKNTLLL